MADDRRGKSTPFRDLRGAYTYVSTLPIHKRFGLRNIWVTIALILLLLVYIDDRRDKAVIGTVLVLAWLAISFGHWLTMRHDLKRKLESTDDDAANH
jgi:hypothetical protein